jgi:hypothetical protein
VSVFFFGRDFTKSQACLLIQYFFFKVPTQKRYTTSSPASFRNARGVLSLAMTFGGRFRNISTPFSPAARPFDGRLHWICTISFSSGGSASVGAPDCKSRKCQSCLGNQGGGMW